MEVIKSHNLYRVKNLIAWQ